MAVALMRALHNVGVAHAGIKWPNDLLVDERKLAGILVEVAGESDGPCHAVIGVGLNYAMPDLLNEQITQPWIDLKQCGVELSRNRVAGVLLNELLTAVHEYESDGLSAFVDEYERWDLMAGRTVAICNGENCEYGVACGIDERGLLKLKNEHGIQLYASGEVSLRSVTR
jgi:BirA family biotin operon repressor/biotin-[acetyl-CoA-carboxylase] ligase